MSGREQKTSALSKNHKANVMDSKYDSVYICIYIYNNEQEFVKIQMISIFKIFEHIIQTRLFELCIYMLFQKVVKQFMAKKDVET